MMNIGAYICQLTAVVVMVCIGVVWNSFNLVMAIQRQLKTKCVQTMSLIIFSISISNNILVLSCFFIVLSVSLNQFHLCSLVQPQCLVMLFLWLSSSCMSFWSIALLSVFYCVKVVNFTTECLRALKKNISFIINTALLLNCVGSALMFFPFFTLQTPADSSETSGNNKTSNATNMTCIMPVFTPLINTDVYNMFYLCFLCPFPLMIMLPTSIRMVIYLCQHVLTLRKNQTQVQGLDSYLSVCKLNVSLSAVYLTTLIIVAVYFILEIIGSDVSYLLIIFGFSFYCIMTAALLTASEKYLKEKFLSMCCCWQKRQQKNSEKKQMETEAA